jgi:hypothetical protein
MHWLYQNRIQMPRSWQDAVRAADTEDDVLDLVRDFLAQFSPEEVAQLPHDCRPAKIIDARDVTEYAFELARNRCDEAGDGADVLHRLSAFFTDANERLAEIMRVPVPRAELGYRPSR